MNPSLSFSRHSLGVAVALVLGASAAWAAGPDKAAIESAYQRDRAACQALSPTQDRTACLRDAGAHRAQALRSGIRGDSSQNLERNALQRCQSHSTPQDQARCERMVRGEGSVSGSVAAGGTIRELVTQEPLPPMPAPPPPMPPTPMEPTPPTAPLSPPIAPMPQTLPPSTLPPAR